MSCSKGRPLRTLNAPGADCWFLWEPNKKLGGTGGLRLLHRTARALLDLGLCVRMVYVRPAFAYEISDDPEVIAAVNMSLAEFDFERIPLRRGDTLVAPEVASEFPSTEAE